MTTLYVTEPGATVRLTGRALAITSPPAPAGDAEPPAPQPVRGEVELHRLELVGLVGRVHVTRDALFACLEEGVALAYFDRGGRFRARLAPAVPRSADLRLRQYTAWSPAGGGLSHARRLVAAKLRNAAQVLHDLFVNYPDTPIPDGTDGALLALADQAGQAAAAETLLGLEGAGARRYFQALAAAFRGDIAFTGRAQHPSPDPANALLSFAYVLLANLLAGLLEARGLDPALGFFHEVRPGRSSLALDLLEEFRHPVVDRFVVRACNLRIFRPELFEADAERLGGVRLAQAGMRPFFTAWEKFLHRPLRDADETAPLPVLPLLRRQVERLVADLRGGPPYRPLAYGG